MMTNLHARSTPTNGADEDNRALADAIRAGQSEAIAEALERGGSTPLSIPFPRRGEGEGEVSSHGVPASAGHPVHRVQPVHKLPLLLIGAWCLFSWSLVFGASATLAEVPAASPHALGSWLISAAAALSILALGKQFMRKTPLEAQFLTKREFQDFKDKDFADLRNRIDHSHESLSNKLDGINNRLHDVGSLVARLDERTKSLNRERKEQA